MSVDVRWDTHTRKLFEKKNRIRKRFEARMLNVFVCVGRKVDRKRAEGELFEPTEGPCSACILTCLLPVTIFHSLRARNSPGISENDFRSKSVPGTVALSFLLLFELSFAFLPCCVLVKKRLLCFPLFCFCWVIVVCLLLLSLFLFVSPSFLLRFEAFETVGEFSSFKYTVHISMVYSIYNMCCCIT